MRAQAPSFGCQNIRRKLVRALTRFLRFIVGIQGAIVTGGAFSESEDAVEIKARRHRNAKPRCPECSQVLVGKIVTKTRKWRHLDFAGVRSFLVAEVREGRCPKHGRRVERVPWATSAARHTHAFDFAVASLVQVANKSAAARMFAVTWPTVGRIVERVVDSLLPKNRFAGLRAITVDETSYKRGHRYLTVVSCAETGRVVWVEEGKSGDTLARFFEELGEARSKQIKVVAMDMSGAYIAVVEHYAPNADIVFDRFHVVQLLLRAIDDIRREECRALSGKARTVIKNTRFAILRNPEYRTPKDLETIRRIRRTNWRLFRAYQLRVDFEELWKCSTEKKACNFLQRWTTAALASGFEPLCKFARTVRRHLHGILGFFRHSGLTSAVAEGKNNKIKLIIHRAFGFASIRALLSMIYLCCSGLQIPTA